MAKNRSLRSNINDLRQEMIAYKEVNSRLKQELTNKKQQMEQELKEAEQVFMAKEEARKKLTDLRSETE